MSLASFFGFKKTYVVEGVELVYDAFDELEGRNYFTFETEARSLEEALNKGRQTLQDQINDYRKKTGCMSSGTFIGEVERVLNKKGKVLYERK